MPAGNDTILYMKRFNGNMLFRPEQDVAESLIIQRIYNFRRSKYKFSIYIYPGKV